MTTPSPARVTRIAQVSTLALAGVAAGVMVLGGRDADPAPEATLSLPELPAVAKPQSGQPEASAFDVATVSQRFAAIGNAPRKPAPPPVVATDVPGATQPVAPPPVVDDLRYLGHVGLGSSLLAMVFEGGRQRVVSVRDQLLAGTLIEVRPEEIVVEKDGVRRTVTLATRDGMAITASNPMLGPTAATSVGRMSGRSVSTISPDQIRAMRAANAGAEPVVMTMVDPTTGEKVPVVDPRELWMRDFDVAMQRLMDSGNYKDAGEVKEVAARYADGMQAINDAIKQGADVESIEKRRSILLQDLPTELQK
jgi:hypothetical protein